MEEVTCSPSARSCADSSARRRSALMRMPKARAMRAAACPMSPNPTTPSALPLMTFMSVHSAGKSSRGTSKQGSHHPEA